MFDEFKMMCRLYLGLDLGMRIEYNPQPQPHPQPGSRYTPQPDLKYFTRPYMALWSLQVHRTEYLDKDRSLLENKDFVKEYVQVLQRVSIAYNVARNNDPMDEYLRRLDRENVARDNDPMDEYLQRLGQEKIRARFDRRYQKKIDITNHLNSLIKRYPNDEAELRIQAKLLSRRLFSTKPNKREQIYNRSNYKY